MSSPSAYLETSLARWSDRGALLRSDAALAVDDLQRKVQFFVDLRETIRGHRREDLRQLAEARQEGWSRWEERLKRLEEWEGKTAVLTRASEKHSAWRDAALWFDRAQEVFQSSAGIFARKTERLEKEFVQLNGKVQAWLDRLLLKETELGKSEMGVSSERKRACQDFVFAERDEEARLARQLKTIRASLNHVLRRFERAEKWAARQTASSPGYFEIRKNQTLEAWLPLQRRFQQIREVVLTRAISFEEGRQRLRSVYDTVQRMRVVQETAPRRRPLLHRLFNWESD